MVFLKYTEFSSNIMEIILETLNIGTEFALVNHK